MNFSHYVLDYAKIMLEKYFFHFEQRENIFDVSNVKIIITCNMNES